MKRVIPGINIIAVWFLFFFTAAGIISTCSPVFSAEETIARLTDFSGTVLIKSRGSWAVDPEKNLPLYSGDKVVTKVGIATLTFNDGAVMEINPNSNLLVKETEEEKETSFGEKVKVVKRRLRLLLGKMFFRTGRSARTETSLETTTMVCGLRGTAGTLSIDAQGQTYLQFTEGGGDTVGNFITGVADDVPTEVAELNPAQRAAFIAAAAADQAEQASERVATGEIAEADAALIQARAAEAAAQESKAAAKIMLDNPDPSVRDEAAAVISAADAAIQAALEAQEQAIESGATLPEDGQTEGVVADDVDDLVEASLTGEVDETGEALTEEEPLFDVDTEDLFSDSDLDLEDEDLRISDVIPPDISIIDRPDPVTNSSEAYFEFTSSEEGTFSYRLDNWDSVPVEAPGTLGGPIYFRLSDLTEGDHQLTIIAEDEEGNISSTDVSWAVDKTSPSGLASMASVLPETINFGLSSADAHTVTYDWSLTGGAGTSLTGEGVAEGNPVTISDLGEGSYTFSWKAVDEAGNFTPGENVTFDVIKHKMEGLVSGTGSVITGTSENSAYEVVGSDWSGWTGISKEMSGTWTGTHTGALSLVSGGAAGDAYTLGFSTGTISDAGAATGTSEFSLLTPKVIINGTGSFTGNFAGDGTWTGTEAASGITDTPLSFSSNFAGAEAGSLYRLFYGTFYEKEFEKYEYEEDYYTHFSEYEYGYFLANSYFDFSGDNPQVSDADTVLYGFRELELDQYQDYSETEEFYLPLKTQTGMGLLLFMGKDAEPPTGWYLGTLDPSFFTDPADMNIDLSSGEWNSRFSEELAGLSLLAQSGDFSGILGGTGDLWSGTGITLLGTYKPWDGGYGDPSLFEVRIRSSEITGGGTYAGFMLGTIGSSVTGGLSAVYVKDDGSGGVLSGNFTGTTYRDIAMWDGEGSVTPTLYTQNTGITPDALEESIDKGLIAGWVSGDFGTTGSVIKNEQAWGRTLSVSGNNNWGIFSMLHGGGNYYYNPRGSESWTARIGGLFLLPGEHGYWLSDEISGTASGGNLYAAMTGKLFTFTRYADLTGSLTGTYDGPSYTWQAASLGTWNGTELAFVNEFDSEVRHGGWETYGSYNYYYDAGGSAGGYYHYNYNEDNTWGRSEDHPSETGGYKETVYHGNGIVVIKEYDASGNIINTTQGTWTPDDTQLSNVVAEPNPPDGQYAADHSTGQNVISNCSGDLEGFMGGTASLWTGSDIGAYLMGEYCCDGSNIVNGVWSDTVIGYDFINDTETTYDGGAYYGYMGGIAEGNGYAGTLEGGLWAMYIDPYGNAGYLMSPLAGLIYQEIEMFEMEGTINRVKMAEGFGIPARNLVSNISESYFTLYGSGNFNAGGVISTETYTSGSLSSIQGENWGLWSFSAIGEYNDTTSDEWYMGLTDDDEYELMGIYGSQWSSGEMSADAAGSWVDIESAQTGIMGGELLGTFNPNTYTWESVAAGVRIETGRFLEMVQNNTAALEELNIPCIEIGKTKLTGTAAGIDVNMNEVTYFAYSTGADPRIWASGDVNGTFESTPVPGTTSVTLSNQDSSISAGFSVSNWDSNTWGAEVNGSGTLDRTDVTGTTSIDIEFTGNAAGSYTGTAGGSFSGKGSGIAGPLAE